MGWSGVHFDESIRTAKEKRMAMDYEVNDGLNKVLKSSMVGNTYYAAVKGSDGDVFGLVGLVKVRNTEFINLYYKLIRDIEGPVEAKCPRSILALLTPTDDETANNWRNRCYGEAQRKKLYGKVNDGDLIIFEKPILFNNGDCFTNFTVVKRGKTIVFARNGEFYEIKDWKKRRYSIAR